MTGRPGVCVSLMISHRNGFKLAGNQFEGFFFGNIQALMGPCVFKKKK